MSTAAQNAAVGRFGERVAERALIAAGMVIVDRNWRCADGEIDIVARDGDELVVCEVKTRTGTNRGHPLEAIDTVKLDRMMCLAQRWIDTHGVHPQGIRLDVVSVIRHPAGPAEVEHVRDFG